MLEIKDNKCFINGEYIDETRCIAEYQKFLDDINRGKPIDEQRYSDIKAIRNYYHKPFESER